MKKITILFVCLCSLISCISGGYNFTDNDFKTSNKHYSFIQSYKTTSPSELKIATSGGNIEAIGNSSDSITVAFIVTKHDKVLDVTLEELKKLADVEIVTESNKLQITIRKTYERNLSVGFRIKTPNKSSCNFNTSGGNISINNLDGLQDISTSGGDIDIDKISGKIKASTSGGNVSLSNVIAECDASTSGGNISLNNINGRLYVSTSGGNIDASDTKP